MTDYNQLFGDHGLFPWFLKELPAGESSNTLEPRFETPEDKLTTPTTDPSEDFFLPDDDPIFDSDEFRSPPGDVELVTPDIDMLEMPRSEVLQIENVDSHLDFSTKDQPVGPNVTSSDLIVLMQLVVGVLQNDSSTPIIFMADEPWSLKALEQLETATHVRDCWMNPYCQREDCLLAKQLMQHWYQCENKATCPVCQHIALPDVSQEPEPEELQQDQEEQQRTITCASNGKCGIQFQVGDRFYYDIELGLGYCRDCWRHTFNTEEQVYINHKSKRRRTRTKFTPCQIANGQLLCIDEAAMWA